MRRLLPEFKEESEVAYLPVRELYSSALFPILPKKLQGRLREVELNGAALPTLKVIKGTTTVILVDIPRLGISGKDNKEVYMLSYYAQRSSVACEGVVLSTQEELENRKELQKLRKGRQVEKYLDDNQLEAARAAGQEV